MGLVLPKDNLGRPAGYDVHERSVSQATTISEEEAISIGIEAYIFGYPLVTMEMTRRVMTNVKRPEGTRAPMGQLVKMREYAYGPDSRVGTFSEALLDEAMKKGWTDQHEERLEAHLRVREINGEIGWLQSIKMG